MAVRVLNIAAVSGLESIFRSVAMSAAGSTEAVSGPICTWLRSPWISWQRSGLCVSLQEKLEQQPLGNVQELGTGAVKKLFNDDIESIELMLAHVIPEGITNLTVPAVILLGFGFAASRQMYSVGMDRMGSYFAASKRLNNTII